MPHGIDIGHINETIHMRSSTSISKWNPAYLDESALRTLEPTLAFPLACGALSPALASAAATTIPALTSGGGAGTGGPGGAAFFSATAGKRTGTGCGDVAAGAPPAGAGDGVSGCGGAGTGGPLCLLGSGTGAAPSPSPAGLAVSPSPSWWRTVRRRRGRNAGRAWKALWSLSQMLGGLPAAGCAAAAVVSFSACITHKLALALDVGALPKGRTNLFYRQTNGSSHNSIQQQLVPSGDVNQMELHSSLRPFFSADAPRTKRAKESIHEPTRSGITFGRQKGCLYIAIEIKLSPVEIFRKDLRVEVN